MNRMTNPVNPVRREWVSWLDAVVRHPLTAAASGDLRRNLPHRDCARPGSQPLECIARILCGIAPWLVCAVEDPDEAALQKELRALTQRALTIGVDPAQADYWGIGSDHDSLVDTALLAYALLKAPRLLEGVSEETRAHLIQAFKLTRDLQPYRNNWLLFSACVEAALDGLGERVDEARVDDALCQHSDWYLGDGWYSDGPDLHMDYYNSFVIHPLMRQILDVFHGRHAHWDELRNGHLGRAGRLAHQLERMIAVNGSWPPIGRSLSYRCGAFHALADVAAREELPETLPPAAVRGALTATIRKSLGAKKTFTDEGWLTIGLNGQQLSLAENYISTASTYFCCTVFLPLALPSTAAFWSDPDSPWTQVRLWESGEAIPIDHAL